MSPNSMCRSDDDDGCGCGRGGGGGGVTYEPGPRADGDGFAPLGPWIAGLLILEDLLWQ